MADHNRRVAAPVAGTPIPTDQAERAGGVGGRQVSERAAPGYCHLRYGNHGILTNLVDERNGGAGHGQLCGVERGDQDIPVALEDEMPAA